MMLRFEAWTLPTSGTFKKIRDIESVLKGSTGVKELSGWTNERIVVPASWPHIDDLISDTSGCLIAAYIGDTLVDEMKADRVVKPTRRPSQRQLTGPQINGIVQELGVYPWRYPDDKPNTQDWIWDGDNVIGDLDLTDLGHIKATFELALLGERYELDTSSPSSGTFLLSFDGNDTDPIDFDAGLSTIKSAVEDLPGITEVTVLQPDPDTRRFFLIFETPKDLPSDLTADWAGVDNPGDLTKMNDGFDPDTDTFTITVDGDTTEALAANVSASGLEGVSETLNPPGSGLQGLTTVQDVRVSGSGTAADPFTFVFYDPPAPGSVSVTFSGTADLTEVQEGALDPSPITRSQEADQRVDELIHGTYDDPAIEVVVDPAHQDGDSDWVLRVNALTQFGGSQLVRTVTPGQTYQAKIRVKPTVDGEYTLVFRELNGNFIQDTSPRHVPLTAGEYGDLIVEDLEIPDGVNQVIMRVAVVDFDPAAWADFYIDWQHAELIEGMGPATATKILRQLLEAGQARGAFEFLEIDATDTHDTAGVELENLSFTAFFGQNLGHVLDNLHDMGYEWRIVRKDTITTTTHKLQVWADGPEDLTLSPGGPSVLAGGAVQDAEVVKRIPPFTALLAHGSEALRLEDIDANALGNMGRIERIVDAEHIAGVDSLQRFLDAQFADEASNREAAVATVRGDAETVPLLHYTEGNKIWWQFPGLLEKQARRVRRVTWEHDDTPRFTVQGSKVFKPEAALAKAVDRLLREFRRRYSRDRQQLPVPRGGGGIPDVVVAADDTKFKEDADLTCGSLGNDQVTIHQAIDRLPDTGGWIHFLEGTYTVNGPITVPAGKNVKFTGAGSAAVPGIDSPVRGSSLITVADSASIAAVFQLAGSSPRMVSFEDLLIDGNKSSATVTSGLITSTSDTEPRVHLTRVILRNSSSRGIYGDRDVGEWFLTDVTSVDNDGDGIRLRECNVWMKGVRSLNNGGAGYRSAYAGHHHVANSQFHGNGDGGIGNGGLAGANTPMTIVGCSITDNTGDGIDAVHAGIEQPIVVVGNTITGNTGRSVLAHPASVVAANLIHSNGTDTPIPDSGNVIDGENTGGGGGGGPATFTFSSQPSVELTIGTGSFRFVAPAAGTILGIRAAVGDPATGADLVVDVNLNGSTLFTTQANRPSITDGSRIGAETVPDVATVTEGDFFTVDIDQVGSTFGGADLTVTVEIEWSSS